MNISSNISNQLFLKELEANLLEQLKLTYQTDQIINDDLLESLYFIYKSPLLEVLNQIDKYDQQEQQKQPGQPPSEPLVSIVKCDKRFIYQVKGSFNYYLFDKINFCTCSSFKYNVLHKAEYIYCKHMIMIKLLTAMNRVPVREVKENELFELIKHIQ
ncbi:unnamed protein product [Brachionus calyciflorus]|uniref:SWIM-type domain-containing protein n=1 Tax=Brachionus calyciflorus TaxID=104777 RepID=A0A813M255_9BILA|nr:unnamed protein product [Brachionus calyciflorus]